MFTPAEEAAIRSVVAIECDRQHVGLDRREFLFAAYLRACRAGSAPTGELVLSLAGELEPDNGARLRITPVTFASGGYAVPPASVAHAYAALFAHVGEFAGADEPSVRYWTREFLVIHPFTDGNGRTAWLLYNWLLGTWRAPVELPLFF